MTTHAIPVRLVPISRTGVLAEPLPEPPAVAADVMAACAAQYAREGFEPPWVAYLAFEGERCVGSCAFKSPPQNARVEIAYFTFPEHEHRGVATGMARALLALAAGARPGIVVTAQTLPRANASTRILRKLGFARAGTAHDDEVGEVWCWELATG
jgi:RimJ/RimL family protein N-acetyltransferase